MIKFANYPFAKNSRAVTLKLYTENMDAFKTETDVFLATFPKFQSILLAKIT